MRKYLLYLWLFCFLVSCSSTTTSKVDANDQCAATGKVQLGKDAANWPVATGNWSMFRGNLSHTGLAMNGASKLKPAWTYCTGGPVFASPIIEAGIAYIASTDRTVAALEIQHGRLLWQFQTDTAVYSTPLIDHEILYVAALSGTFYALDKISGRLIWQTKIGPAGANLWSSPTIANGLIIFGVASSLNERPKVPGQVVALDARTGQLRWRTYTQVGGAPGAGVWSSPVVDLRQRIVYVGTGDPDDGVQAFRLADGHLLWHWRSVMNDISDTDVGAGPLLYNDKEGRERIVVGGKDGFLYSLDASIGQLVWKTPVDEQIYASPALENGKLYTVGVAGGRSTCLALDVETGRQLWKFVTNQKGYSSPVVSGNVLYLGIGNGFGPGNGGIDVLDARNGQLLQQLSMQTTASSSPAVLANWVLLGTNNGNVNAFVRI
jgi:outer membrane protein assembly factor BamB